MAYKVHPNAMSSLNKLRHQNSDDIEAQMAQFISGTGYSKAVRVARREDVPRADLLSDELEVSLASKIRIEKFKIMLPSSQSFILAIYGNYNIYLSYSNLDHDPNQILFDACMLHSRSFVDSICAVRGLQLLNIPVKEPANVCHLGGCGEEDPVQKFHRVMVRICHDSESVASYREN
jgi:hypothetical protein